MKAKELKHKMLDMIYLGHSRQEIYDHYRSQFPGRSKDLADILVGIPTLKQRNAMSIPRVVLIIILVLTIGLKIGIGLLTITTFGYGPLITAMLVSAVSIYFLVKIVKWEPWAFKSLGGLHSFFLINLSLNGRQLHFDFNLLSGSIFVVAVIGLSFFIASQIGGKAKVFHKQIRKPDGKIVTEMTHSLT